VSRFPVGPLPGYRTRRKEHALSIGRDEFRSAIPRSGWSPPEPPSRPGELHPEALTDPDLSLSTHPARATSESCRFPPKPASSFCCQLTQIDLSAGDLPPSLRRHYPASSLLRGSPPLIGASVLSTLRCARLYLFPSHRRSGSQVPYKSQSESHAACTPDTTRPVSRLPPCSSRSRDAPRF
jgi:hypothetical protein